MSTSKPPQTSQGVHGTYFPHIDGIRAFAVLPVMLFHVLSRLCPGGFAGVDVFFVISGYLITGGILRDLEKGRFTIAGFYHRRIRRIMPAYFALIAGVFAVGCVLYYALPLMGLGDTAIAGTLFSANIFFYITGGMYFAADLHGNALLHLWSLSVEEQFYLFIPLLCATIWKFRRGLVAPMLALIAIISLSSAIYVVAVSGATNNAPFYLLHFRAWELLTGSLLAMLPPLLKPGVAGFDRSVRLRAVLPVLGLLLVVAPYVMLTTATPFPGAAAVPSVLGAALLIRYAERGWVGRLLASRPLVAIGKISYSLYLWHWPVTVFWRYVTYGQLYVWDYIGMFGLSLLLGWLSWKFVEQPVRTSPNWTPRRTFSFAAAGITLLVSIGLVCVYSKGWPSVLHPTANRVSAVSDYQSFTEQFLVRRSNNIRSLLKRPEIVPFGPGSDVHLGSRGVQPEVFLIGDSHAAALQHGLDQCLREEGRAGYAVNRDGVNMCDLSNPECRHALSELARRPGCKQVILAMSWYGTERRRLTPAPDAPSFFAQIEQFSRRVIGMERTLYIFTDVPFRDDSPSEMAARTKIIAPRHLQDAWVDGKLNQADYEAKQGEINRNLDAICRKTGATLVPMHTAFRQGAYYIAFDEQHGQPIPLYRDVTHLTQYGGLFAMRFAMPYLSTPATTPVTRLGSRP